jgi:hypothetical protein
MPTWNIFFELEVVDTCLDINYLIYSKIGFHVVVTKELYLRIRYVGRTP